MARHFVRLKLRLMRNNLRRSTQALIGTIFGVLGAIAIGVNGLLGIVSTRSNVIGLDLMTIILAVVWVGWVILPVVAYGIDETLDPSKLDLIPIPRRKLMGGLLAASSIGIGPLMTAVIFTGVVVAYTATAGLVAIVAAVLAFLVCVTSARAVTGVLSEVLGSRRGRDVLVTATLMLAILFSLSGQFVGILIDDFDTTSEPDLSPISDVLQWTPTGTLGRAVKLAANGDLSGAWIRLVAVAALVPLMLWIWDHSLRRRAVSGGSSSGAQPRVSALIPSWIPLPKNRTGAVAARVLRYVARDPQVRTQAMSGVFLLVPTMAFPLTTGGGLTERSVLFASVAVIAASALAAAQFGMTGRAQWLHATLPGDPRQDLIGADLALFTVGMTTAMFVAVGVAAVTGGWAWIGPAMVLSVGGALSQLGSGNLASVLAPYPLPEQDGTTLFGNQSGVGFTQGVVALLVFLLQMVLLAPMMIGMIVLGDTPGRAYVMAFLGLAYGAGFFLILTNIAGRRLVERWPEVLAAVQPSRD